jgi:hypothetical protein
MQINSEFIIGLFRKPSLILQCNPHEQSSVVLILRSQKLLARFAHVCDVHNLLPDLHLKTRAHLKSAFRHAQGQKDRVSIEAKLLTEQLKSSASYVVFLKGAAYSLSNKEVGKGRIYSDIDILVNKNAIYECEQVLNIHGWVGQDINDYDDRYYRKWAHEIPPLVHSIRGTVIDVHHNIIPVVSKDAPTIEMLETYIIKNDDGIHMLNPAAQFVHSAVHLFRNEDYKGAFRDLLDLHLMLAEYSSKFIDDVIEVAEHLGFAYEVGLAFDSLNQIMQQDVAPDVISRCVRKASIRLKFDRYIFSDVLLPQHTLMEEKIPSFKHFLAILRGHYIKMPLPLLVYHLLVKSGRGIIESILGKHVFTKKDEHSEARKF